MSLRSFLFVCLVVFLGLNPVSADEVPVMKQSIKSEIFNEERGYFVKLPYSYDADSDHTYPVIYLLDDKQYIQHFYNVIDHLSAGGVVPEFLLVGIEHKQRLRDLTPTEMEGRPGSGGADEFLSFIEKELVPHIEKKYQTKGFRVLAGHSFGGLFTLHAMQAKPALFDAWFAFSPSLYWDDKGTVKSVKNLLQSKPDYKSFLYMNMGNEGLDDPYPGSIAMREGYMELVNFLDKKAPEHFRFASEHMEDQYHMATVVAGPFDAITEMFRKFPLPTSKVKQGLSSIVDHYEQLSEEVGYQVEPTSGRLFNAGMYHMWANEDLEKGIEIMRYNIKLNPDSARLYDGLAQLYQANKQPDKALEQAQLSVDKADPESGQYQNYLSRVENIKAELDKAD